MSRQFESPQAVMRHALQLAERGRGFVEPNPLVGAVVTDANLHKIAEGYHERFGGAHAEVNALNSAGAAAQGAYLFVTLEPCNHHGKTPPCTEAVIAAGIKKVFIGCPDPAPHNDQQGIRTMQQAGIDVETGLLETAARTLLRPFTKKILTGKPYIHAKWAMTLDGKIATRTGSSQWISNPESRQRVHQLRGQMDGILVGRGTVTADDPLLTVRPAGPRVPLRIVLDSQATLDINSQLVRTIQAAPVLLVCREDTDPSRLQFLRQQRVDIMFCAADAHGKISIPDLLTQLGQLGLTNLLVEGGAGVLGSFLDEQAIDEVHAFIAPKLVGGSNASTPVEGQGIAEMASAILLKNMTCQQIADDIYLHGHIPFHDARLHGA